MVATFLDNSEVAFAQHAVRRCDLQVTTADNVEMLNNIVSILGFGSFEPRERSARQGLNPKTGEKIKIPAKRVPAFTAGKMFKDRVQG